MPNGRMAMLAKSVACAGALGISLIATQTMAKSTPEELAKLGLTGTELTPAGAIRAGNAEGTIPEWKNEPIPVPPDFKPGTHYIDPFPDDEILFTITAQNYKEHADKLTLGHQKMFEVYPDYKMNVYTTRRTAVFKENIYKAALENAARAELVENPNRENAFGFKNGILTWAFPTPHDGREALLNVYTRPQPEWQENWEDSGAPVTTTGSYEPSRIRYQIHQPYSNPENTTENFDPTAPGSGFWLIQTIMAPARLAGQAILVRDPLTFANHDRQAWLYNPGQRRVKRAPQIAYDYPATATDGLMATDTNWGYNGPTDRFEWTLEGRQEMYVPYNSYKLASGDIKIKDIITDDGRLNQDLARYELHRVWKIAGTLRDGTTHIYGKRTMYVDEDSWWILVHDVYDTRGELWRLQELPPIQFYDVQFFRNHKNLSYDFQAGRMMIRGLSNEDPDMAPDFTWRGSESDFTPAGIRRGGIR